MTTMTPPTPPASRNRARTWSMRLSGEPDALMRVLTLLRRRRCEVLGVRYDLGGRGRPAWLRVSVRPAGGRPEALEPWLEGLVDVLELRCER